MQIFMGGGIIPGGEYFAARSDILITICWTLKLT